jgi:hypothetical protein
MENKIVREKKVRGKKLRGGKLREKIRKNSTKKNTGKKVRETKSTGKKYGKNTGITLKSAFTSTFATYDL